MHHLLGLFGMPSASPSNPDAMRQFSHSQVTLSHFPVAYPDGFDDLLAKFSRQRTADQGPLTFQRNLSDAITLYY